MTDSAIPGPSRSTTGPSGTAPAPQGIAPAPQGIAPAPQGIATAPQGIATEPAAAATETSGEARALPRDIRKLIKPGDRVLEVNFQGVFTKPEGVSRWTELGFQREAVRVPEIPSPGRTIALRDPRVDVAAWQWAMDEIKKQTLKALEGCQGSLHVFPLAPHPAAMLLGRWLWKYGRQTPVYIHQWFDSWAPFVFPRALWPADRSQPYFGDLLDVPIQGGDGPVVLSIEMRQAGAAVTPPLEAMLRLLRGRALYRIGPVEDWKLRPEQVRHAVEQLEAVFDTLHGRHQGASIHVVTSAPIGLIVELGRRLRPTVFSQLVVHQYDAQSRSYVPILDIVPPQVLEGQRDRLEIFSGGRGTLLFNLNGRVLEQACPDLKGRDGLERRGAVQNTFIKQAARMSTRLLPEEVERRLEGYPVLDIDIRVDGKAEDLSWEFLYLGRTSRQFAVKTPDWSMVRVIKPPDLGSSNVNIKPAGELRILVMPALDPSDDDREKLGLADLEKVITSHETKCRVLDWFTPLEEFMQVAEDFRPDVLHWFGHGQHDNLDGSDDILVVNRRGEKHMLGRDRFRDVIRRIRPRMVVLCACEVGNPQGGYGVPRDLIADGVGAVLAFRDQTSMGEIGAFSRRLYEELLAGARLRDAVQQARVEIHTRHLFRFGAFGGMVLTCVDARATGPLVTRPVVPEAQERSEGGDARNDGATGGDARNDGATGGDARNDGATSGDALADRATGAQAGGDESARSGRTNKESAGVVHDGAMDRESVNTQEEEMASGNEDDSGTTAGTQQSTDEEGGTAGTSPIDIGEPDKSAAPAGKEGSSPSAKKTTKRGPAEDPQEAERRKRAEGRIVVAGSDAIRSDVAGEERASPSEVGN